MGWPCFLYLLEEPSGATYVGCTRRPLERAQKAERKGWTLRAILGPIDSWKRALQCRDEWRSCPAAPLTAGWLLSRIYALQIYGRPPVGRRAVPRSQTPPLSLTRVASHEHSAAAGRVHSCPSLAAESSEWA